MISSTYNYVQVDFKYVLQDESFCTSMIVFGINIVPSEYDNEWNVNFRS